MPKKRSRRNKNRQVVKRPSASPSSIAQGPVHPNNIALLQAASQTTTIGPFPSAREMAGYYEIDPALAEKILAHVKTEQDHRHKMENAGLDSQINENRRGQWLAFWICFSVIFCGTYAIVRGHEWAGTFLGLGGLAGLAAAFLKKQ